MPRIRRLPPNPACPVVAVDLDGVLHEYSRGWTGYELDDPLPGAVAFVDNLIELGYDPVVYTARADCQRAFGIIYAWLDKWGFPPMRVYQKIVAVAYVDDRGIHCDPHVGGASGFGAALDNVERLAARHVDAPATIVPTRGQVDQWMEDREAAGL